MYSRFFLYQKIKSIIIRDRRILLRFVSFYFRYIPNLFSFENRTWKKKMAFAILSHVAIFSSFFRLRYSLWNSRNLFCLRMSLCCCCCCWGTGNGPASKWRRRRPVFARPRHFRLNHHRHPRGASGEDGGDGGGVVGARVWRGRWSASLDRP